MNTMLFPFDQHWWIYLAFSAFVLLLLAADLGIFHRKLHAVAFREAAIWTAVWASLALLFCLGLYWYVDAKFGPTASRLTALEFLSGYIVEWSRCTTWKWKSGGPASLPVVLKSPVELTATQGEDGIGPAHSPKHAGLFTAGTDHGFASGLDHASAHKQTLPAKLGVAHACSIPVEVFRFDADLFG